MSSTDIHAAVNSIVSGTVGESVMSDAPLMEAGVDSLAASELVSLVSDEFQVELPVTLLFDHPSSASISDFVTQAMQDMQNTVILPLSTAIATVAVR